MYCTSEPVLYSEQTELGGLVINEPFEIRCERAKEMMFNWTRLQNISADDGDKKEERTQYENKIFALLSDPLQIGIDSLLADGSKQEDFIKIVRAMYGDDAVNFVLQVR
jgi:hypothetical protein